MQSLEKRIAALEAAQPNTSLKVVMMESGETEAQALQRVGYPPDAATVMFIELVGLTEAKREKRDGPSRMNDERENARCCPPRLFPNAGGGWLVGGRCAPTNRASGRPGSATCRL